MDSVDHKKTYSDQAEMYERLIHREDYEENLLPAIEEITPVSGKRIADLGAGTGRLADILARKADQITELDLSWEMLRVAHEKATQAKFGNVVAGVGDHRAIPLASESMDIVLSGWSICYLVDWNPQSWKNELRLAFDEIQRVLRKRGMIILLETMGTGFESPHPPPHLANYFQYLEQVGFSRKWVRTDYRFKDLKEAMDLSGFFFGKDLAEMVKQKEWVVLPECTGVWWCSREGIHLP